MYVKKIFLLKAIGYLSVRMLFRPDCSPLCAQFYPCCCDLLCIHEYFFAISTILTACKSHDNYVPNGDFYVHVIALWIKIVCKYGDKLSPCCTLLRLSNQSVFIHSNEDRRKSWRKYKMVQVETVAVKCISFGTSYGMKLTLLTNQRLAFLTVISTSIKGNVSMRSSPCSSHPTV